MGKLAWRRRGEYSEAETPVLLLRVLHTHFGDFHGRAYRRMNTRRELRIPDGFFPYMGTKDLGEMKASLERFAADPKAVLAALARSHEQDLADDRYGVVTFPPPTREHPGWPR